MDDCDYVIVGSGAGGGTLAGTLVATAAGTGAGERASGLPASRLIIAATASFCSHSKSAKRLSMRIRSRTGVAAQRTCAAAALATASAIWFAAMFGSVPMVSCVAGL